MDQITKLITIQEDHMVCNRFTHFFAVTDVMMTDVEDVTKVLADSDIEAFTDVNVKVLTSL